MEQVFTIKEAAKYLKIGDSTLRKLIKDDKIGYFMARGVYRFSETHLKEFLVKGSENK